MSWGPGGGGCRPEERVLRGLGVPLIWAMGPVLWVIPSRGASPRVLRLMCFILTPPQAAGLCETKLKESPYVSTCLTSDL